MRTSETESRITVAEVVFWGRFGLMFSGAGAEGRAAVSANPQSHNCRGGRLQTMRCLEMSAVGFEPTRSYLQWILSPPPEPLGQTDCCPCAKAAACL